MTNEEINKLQEELAEYQKKTEEYLNSWKRTAADFENYKKRREKENSELMEFAQSLTVVQILPLLESLEQALRAAPADERFKNWTDGVLKIVEQLEKTLLHLGVEKIKTAGEKFDPLLHEAVEQVESDKETGTILEEIQGGFRLNDKVIRPAKVRVAK